MDVYRFMWICIYLHGLARICVDFVGLLGSQGSEVFQPLAFNGGPLASNGGLWYRAAPIPPDPLYFRLTLSGGLEAGGLEA